MKPRIALELVVFAAAHEQLIHAVACREDRETAIRGGTESVVCGVGGGQALYAAELGQWPRKTGKATPIRHLLVYAGHSHAQLGRLVRRMHVLGELRHAAVMDWDLGSNQNDLRHASLRLRGLGKQVDEATLKPSFEALRPILTELAEAGRVGETGLNYRVEQSRYYAEEYLAQLEHLRVVRLGDWQPYDDFVRRQITQLFNRINRIGNRYEALGRRVDRLILYEQAEGVSAYQGSVGRLLVSIERATKTLNEANGDTVELLVSAEVIASLFAVYYLGTILKEGLVDPEGWFHHWTHGTVPQWGYSLGWLLLAILFPLSVRVASPIRRKRRQMLRAEKAAREEQEALDARADGELEPPEGQSAAP